MPSKKSRSVSPATERRERLTLARLASYDDVATDALVDHVRFSPAFCFSRWHTHFIDLQAYFWTTTRKNRTKYSPARGIHDDDVGRILLHDVVVAKNIPEAERKLLELPGLKKYVATLRTPREKEWFRRHLRKYVQIYHPDCPFEVTTTNRYIITEHEAAICARKPIRAGQEIKYLSGTLVSMTKEEELDLGLTRKDFSVVMSSRRKTPSFFLGPARFANHDCDANGRLVTRGKEGMSVMATRNIEEGEEITVSYGDDYFGIDNCECLCLTCERAVRNGWSSHVKSNENSKETTPVSIDETTPASAGSPSGDKKRRRESDLDSEDATPICSTPRKRAKFQRQSSKLRDEIAITELPSEPTATPESNAPPTPAPDTTADILPPTTCERRPSKLKEEIIVSEMVEATLEAPATPREPAEQPNTDNSTNVKSTGPTDPESPSSAAGESHRSSTSSMPTSVDENDPKVKTDEASENPQIRSEALGASQSQLEATSNSALDQHQEKLSELPDSLEIDDVLQTVVEKPTKRRGRKRYIVTSVEAEAPVARIPGDYTKTSRLLAQKYDRWVDCQTCESWFVQSNSYQTRRECPRCERHSKLYGFEWPKTEGRDRVMDHRTIHRFLSPESEARVSRRDRGVSFGVTPTPDLSDAHTETEASEAPEPRRNTRFTRRRTRELRMTM